MMKKSVLSVAAALLFVMFLAVPSMAWQGRMAGAGDAAGLIEDESDYLIHPAAIASGKGFNAYGYYRLTYDKATKWDYSAGAPSMGVIYPYSTDGDSWKNEGQLGAAFKLGTGRMGVFFEYTGVSGEYSGAESYAGFTGPGYHSYELENDMNNYALKVIYGLPVGAFKVGGELQIAYRDEEQESMIDFERKNYPWAAEDNPALNLYPFMIPFKSKYWEAQGKASVEGSAGPAKYAVTLKAGLPFASDNEYAREDYTMEGDVKGFNVGGDLWARVPLNDRMILPFVVSAGYKTITRDGSGASAPGFVVTHENEVEDIFVKIGGGLDFTPVKGTKIAAGIYYDYLQTEQRMYVDDIGSSEYYIDEYADMPKYTEHRLTIKALAEKELTPAFVLRGGISAFYGFVKSDYAYFAYDDLGAYEPVDLPTEGSNIGINVSVGATFKVDRFSLEPFVNAGYVRYETDGDGTFGPLPATADFEKTNWLVGGGLAAKF